MKNYHKLYKKECAFTEKLMTDLIKTLCNLKKAQIIIANKEAELEACREMIDGLAYENRRLRNWRDRWEERYDAD